VDAQPPAETIVVTAPRLPEAPGAQSYSSYAIDPAELERAARLDEAITLAPGASLFRRNDSAAANPTIQGLSVRAFAPSGAGRALVLLDGVPLNDVFGGWVIWGAVPPDLIGTATVMRGAGAGPYGAGALTGTILLNERESPGVALAAEAGSFGMLRGSGVGEFRSGATDFLLAASSEHRDGFIPVRSGRGAADTRLSLDTQAAVARVQAALGPVTVSARVSGYDEDRGSGLAGGTAGSSGQTASIALLGDPGGDAPAWRVQLWAQRSNLSNATVVASANRSTTTPASNQFRTPATGWGGNAALRLGGADAGGEIGADLRSAEGKAYELFSFASGAFTRERVSGGRTEIYGAYVEGWRGIGDWLFTGGARVDDWRAYDGVRQERTLATNVLTLNTSPQAQESVLPSVRAGVRRTFGGAYFRGALYTGFRPPSLNELHRPFRVGSDVTEANPLLKPERVFGGDAGFGGQHGAWSWDAGVFGQRLVDGITNVTLGVGPGIFPPGVFVPAGGAYRQRQNVGEITAWGLEAEARGAVGALSWRLSGDYTHARVTAAERAPELVGRTPAQAPALTMVGELGIDLARYGEIHALARYESGRYDDDLNTRRLPSATQVDLEYEHHLTPAVDAFVAADNVFDADIATAINAGVVSYAAPRTFRVGVRLRR